MKRDTNNDKKSLELLVDLEPGELVLITGGEKVGTGGTYDYKEQICIEDTVTHP